MCREGEKDREREGGKRERNEKSGSDKILYVCQAVSFGSCINIPAATWGTK